MKRTFQAVACALLALPAAAAIAAEPGPGPVDGGSTAVVQTDPDAEPFTFLDLQHAAPNVVGATTAIPTQGLAQREALFIRGVTGFSTSVGGEAAVAVRLDGRPLHDPDQLGLLLWDVADARILRGPQPVVHGRNASGGAIEVRTSEPDPDGFDGRLSLRAGSFDGRRLTGHINLPLGGGSALRLSAIRDVRAGHVENLTNGETLERSDQTAGRGALLLALDGGGRALLSGYAYRSRPDAAALVVSDYPTGSSIYGFLPNQYARNGAGTNPTVSDLRSTRNDVGSSERNEGAGVVLDVERPIGSNRLRFIAAYDGSDNALRQDVDGSDVVYTDHDERTRYRSSYVELSLERSGRGGSLWFGASHQRTLSEVRSRLESYDYFGPTGFPRSLITIDGKVDSRSYALFARATKTLAERWSVDVGARYTIDDKQSVEDFLYMGRLEADYALDARWEDVSGSATLAYRTSGATQAYLTVADNQTPGGMNLGGTQDVFGPETVTSVEIGHRGALFGGRLRYDARAFHMDYDDKVENQTDRALLMTNAAQARSRGVELSAQAELSDAFSLAGHVGYLDAEYRSFRTGDQNNIAAGVLDRAGSDLPYAPRWTAGLSGSYRWALSDGSNLVLAGEASHVGERYARPPNDAQDRLEAYTLTNARLTWSSADDRYSASVFVENAEDVEVVTAKALTFARFSGVYLGSATPPRIVGLRLTVRR